MFLLLVNEKKLIISENIYENPIHILIFFDSVFVQKKEKKTKYTYISICATIYCRIFTQQCFVTFRITGIPELNIKFKTASTFVRASIHPIQKERFRTCVRVYLWEINCRCVIPPVLTFSLSRSLHFFENFYWLFFCITPVLCVRVCFLVSCFCFCCLVLFYLFLIAI